MRWTMALALTAIVVSPAAATTRTPRQSWGRAGVAYDQYRADAIACGREGYFLDIAQTDDAKAFVRGSRELDDATQNGYAAQSGDPLEAAVRVAQQDARIKLSVQPERRIAHLRSLMQDVVDQCLAKRGYVRFQLTDDQRHKLAKLAIGSQQRRTYMHMLASDPAVLTAQADSQ